MYKAFPYPKWETFILLTEPSAGAYMGIPSCCRVFRSRPLWKWSVLSSPKLPDRIKGISIGLLKYVVGILSWAKVNPQKNKKRNLSSLMV